MIHVKLKGGSPIEGGATTATAAATSSLLLAGLSGGLNDQTEVVEIQPRADIYGSFDGTDAASGTGFLFAADNIFSISRGQAEAMKIIRSGGSDVTVIIQEYT